MAAEWLFVAEVEVSIMGLAEDVCRITLRRGPDADVLRLQHSEASTLDREIRLPACSGSDEAAALAALERAARMNPLSMREATRPGLLTGNQVQEAVSRGEQLWQADRAAITEASWEAVRATPSRIIRVATELRLAPEPTGGSVGNWWARCPGTNHSLMVSARSEQFGCGYCRVRGGPDELRRFASERLRSRRNPPD